MLSELYGQSQFQYFSKTIPKEGKCNHGRCFNVFIIKFDRAFRHQSVLGKLSRKKYFRKVFQSIERANNKIWGARITRVKQMIFSGGILR